MPPRRFLILRNPAPAISSTARAERPPLLQKKTISSALSSSCIRAASEPSGISSARGKRENSSSCGSRPAPPRPGPPRPQRAERDQLGRRQARDLELVRLAHVNQPNRIAALEALGQLLRLDLPLLRQALSLPVVSWHAAELFLAEWPG